MKDQKECQEQLVTLLSGMMEMLHLVHGIERRKLSAVIGGIMKDMVDVTVEACGLGGKFMKKKMFCKYFSLSLLATVLTG